MRGAAKTARMPHVMFFSHALSRDGASISLLELILGLTQRGDVLPSVVAFRNGPLHEDYKAAGIPVFIVPVEVGRLATEHMLAEALRRLRLIMERQCAEIVFANTLLTFPAVLAAGESRLPSVWNPRETEDLRVYFRFLPNYVARRAIAAMQIPKKIICVSRATPQSWHQLPRSDRLTVIPNAINPRRFQAKAGTDRSALRERLGWSAEETVFVCIGTICPNKGQWDAVRAAWQAVRHSGPALRIVFIGHAVGAYGKRIAWTAIACKRLSRRVRLDVLSPTEHVGQYYTAADAVLLCSRSESSPRTVLETLVFGLPLIATNLPGIRDQVSEDDGAFFYTPGNCRALASHMQRLASDKAERRRLAESNRARGSRMAASYQEMLKRYAEVIHVMYGRSAGGQEVVGSQDT